MVPTLGERYLRNFLAAVDSNHNGFIDRKTFVDFLNKKDPIFDGMVTSRLTSPSRVTSRTDLNTESELDEYGLPASYYQRGRSHSPELDPRAHFLSPTQSFHRHLKKNATEKSNKYLEQEHMGWVPGLRDFDTESASYSRSSTSKVKTLSKDSRLLAETENFRHLHEASVKRRQAHVLYERETSKGVVPGLRGSPIEKDHPNFVLAHDPQLNDKPGMRYGSQSPSRDHHRADNFDPRIGEGPYRSRSGSRSTSPRQPRNRSQSPATSSSHRSGLQAAMETLRKEDTRSHMHRHSQQHQDRHQHSYHEKRHDTKYVGGINSPTGYAYTHPCVEEEYEVRMEKKRRQEALERLHKRLQDEREAGSDPNDAEDDGHLRFISNAPPETKSSFDYAESKSYESGLGDSGKGSAPKDATDEDHQREPKGKKISDTKIMQRSRDPRNLPSITDGVVALKHGKTGNPKTRRIIYDPTSMEIRWKPDSEHESIFHRMYTTPPPLSSKHMAPGIKIGFINRVVKGIHTDRLLKAKLVDPACCLSIVTKDRTLDLTLSSQWERNAFFTNLKEFLNTTLTNAHQRIEFDSAP